MNENAKKWVEALRSGQYAQTTSTLRDGSGDWVGYCCLGVACDLSGLGQWELIRGAWHYVIDKGGTVTECHDTALPESVRAWLGLVDCEGTFRRDGVSFSLASRNDRGATFAALADIIASADTEGLFDEQ